MRTVIRKWFWAWDFDKEEAWLNEMAAKGLGLVSVGFARYEFEDCIPGEYSFRIELLEQFPDHPVSRKYIEFIEETGAEQVGSIMKWVYFRKKTADGPFDLFSDNQSRIKHLQRIILLLFIVAIVNIISGCYNLLLVFLWHSYVNLLGLLNLLLAAGILCGTLRLLKKKNRLSREGRIFE